ncbi:hypothetical protein TNCV_774981 [Trichonephila clavipes]|nr:hypothetical protein TNCV_774981 [Trichonephila clavipes]
MILCVAEVLEDQERAKNTDIAREFDIAHSVVSWLWKSFKTTGMCSRRHEGGRVRSTTPAEDIYRPISKNGRTTAQRVTNQFLAASGEKADLPKTVAERLGRRRIIRTQTCCVCPIDQTAPYCRLQWCREHYNWTEQDWAGVLFSDESSSVCLSDCRRQLIWRESEYC